MDKTKVCCQCGQERSLEEFGKSFAKVNGDRESRKNRCKKCYDRRERVKMKVDMLNALGWECACCGEDHPEFLTLEHLDGSGAALRATRVERIKAGLGMEVDIGTRAWTTQQQYRQARREGWPKDRYQVLCLSCNFVKGHFGICPHQSGVTARQARAKLESEIRSVGRNFVNYHPDSLFKVGHKRNSHD